MAGLGVVTSRALHRTPPAAHTGAVPRLNCLSAVVITNAGPSAGTPVVGPCCTVNEMPVAAAVTRLLSSLAMVMVWNAWVNASTAAPPTSPQLGSPVTPYQGLKSE